MPDATYKQNDTSPSLRLVGLKNGDGTYINLASGTVKLLMRKADESTLTLNVSSTSTALSFSGSTSTGYNVTYLWSTGDLDGVGRYEFEVECTLSNSRVITVPSDGFYTLDVIDDLG